MYSRCVNLHAYKNASLRLPKIDFHKTFLEAQRGVEKGGRTMFFDLFFDFFLGFKG